MSVADKFIETFEPAIARLLAAVRRLERFLGPGDDWVEDDRRIIYEAADRLLRPLGRSTISEVSDGDFVYTVDVSADEVEVLLDEAGFQRNLLSTRKYRESNGTRDYANGSWVLVHDGNDSDVQMQLHVIVFSNPDGSTSIYAHREAAVTEPSEHDGGDLLTRGDPNGIVKQLLEENEIGHSTVPYYE